MLWIWVNSWLFNGTLPSGISIRSCNSSLVPEVLVIRVWMQYGLLTINWSVSF